MRAASIVFPFRQTFQRLGLEKRWWHRLFIVAFSVVLLSTAAFIAVISYGSFAPQVSTMPDIGRCDIFDQVAAEQQHQNVPNDGCNSSGVVPTENVDLSSKIDIDNILTEADRAVLPANVPLPPQGAHVDGSMTLKQFGQRIKAKYPVYNDLDDEDLARRVLAKYPQYRNVVKDASNSTSSEPLGKTVEMPDGSTSWFAGTVSDNAIKAKWNHAKTRQTLKAVLLAIAISIAAVLFISYLFQIAYRALLYVIFGSVTIA